MPKGHPVSAEIKEAFLEEYYRGELSVNDLCLKYNIGRRTVYDWIKPGHGRHHVFTRRKSVFMSYKEIELVLLMIMECESILDDKDSRTAKLLEERLLEASDELTERERVQW